MIVAPSCGWRRQIISKLMIYKEMSNCATRLKFSQYGCATKNKGWGAINICVNDYFPVETDYTLIHN